MATTVTKEQSSKSKSKFAPGTFTWVDLATTDAAGAKKFYSALFGWTIDFQPVGNGMEYATVKFDGQEVGGMYEFGQQSGSDSSRRHPRWDSYVLVDNVDQKAQEAKKLGAKVVTEPFDIFEEGRMAMIEDPVGAGLCLWQAKKSDGADRVNEVGSLCWNELHTTEVEKAKQFYSKLFGWKTSEMTFGEGQEYTRIDNGDRPNGGMISAYATKGQPGYWLAYFTVKNLDEATKKTEQNGGKVVFGPMRFEFGALSVITDPQGAFLGLWEETKH
jgi:uncharacterized protein